MRQWAVGLSGRCAVGQVVITHTCTLPLNSRTVELWSHEECVFCFMSALLLAQIVDWLLPLLRTATMR